MCCCLLYTDALRQEQKGEKQEMKEVFVSPEIMVENFSTKEDVVCLSLNMDCDSGSAVQLPYDCVWY